MSARTCLTPQSPLAFQLPFGLEFNLRDFHFVPALTFLRRRHHALSERGNLFLALHHPFFTTIQLSPIMTSRPRRSAAAKATETISVQSKLTDVDDRSDRSGMSSRRSGRGTSRFDDDFDSGNVNSRQPARGSSRRSGNSDDVRHGTRNRGGKKNYVVDSSPDDDDEDDEVDDMDIDADGDDDIDAEGEEDAEGEMDLDSPAPSRSTKPARSAVPKPAAKSDKAKTVISDDDDDELSEANSDIDQTMGMGNDTMADDQSDKGSITVLGDENDRPRDDDDDDDDDDDEEDDEDDEEEEEEDGDAEGETQMEDAEGDDQISSDGDDESRAMTPDLAKMTKRQRARFDDEPQEYMKLSDEVQAKKHFTAEELSMRRQEMARRRRNLSEKRNEEVKV